MERARLFVRTAFSPRNDEAKLLYLVFLVRIDEGKFNEICGFGFYPQWRAVHTVRSIGTQSIAVDAPESAVQIDSFGPHEMKFACRIEVIIIINENNRPKFTCYMLVQANVSHQLRRRRPVHFVSMLKIFIGTDVYVTNVLRPFARLAMNSVRHFNYRDDSVNTMAYTAFR